MKKLVYVLIFFRLFELNAQIVVTPSVINSAGGSGVIPSSTGNIEVYYNIGEPIITTAVGGSITATQGFLQPELITRLNFSVAITHESCLNKKDGKIDLLFNSLPYGYAKRTIKWSPTSVCPGGDCETVDSLAPGIYKIVVKAFNNLSGVGKSISTDSAVVTINSSAEPCLINVFTGFSPNGDNINDFWFIENIEDFQDNKVTIFNRWGNQIAKFTNYNNKDNNWKGEGPNGSQVPNGTYFYVIELNNGSGIKKGWVEVTGK